MSGILSITIFAMFFAFLSHNRSGYDPIHSTYRRKERLFYTVMSIGLILFAGLRIEYNDTYAYLHMYRTAVKEIAAGKGILDGIDWKALGDNPGYFLTIRTMAWLNISEQSHIMLFSVFYIGVNLWFFRKYSCNLWACLRRTERSIRNTLDVCCIFWWPARSIPMR